MAVGARCPRGLTSNIDYWLRRCQGFRVDAPQGRVGFVEEVRYASRCDRPDAIAVRAGRFGRLLLLIPVGEVAEILPEEKLVVLHRSPRPTGTERRQDLREPLQPGGPRGAANRGVEGVGARAKHIEAQREVEAVIERLKRLIGLRRREGGEREVTPDVEESPEPSAEEPSAEEQAGEEAAAEEAPVEEAAEAVPAEEPTAGEPGAEEPAEEEQTTS
jgi:hypothetical protein